MTGHAAVIQFTPGAEQTYRDRGLTIIEWPIPEDPRIARIRALCAKKESEGMDQDSTRGWISPQELLSLLS